MGARTNTIAAGEIAEDLAARIGYRFRAAKLAAEALTHRSYQNENDGVDAHNERLEFLGDAVLDLVVAETLMERMPEAAEGRLTRRRAALVNEQVLARIARALDLGPAIRLGKGEEKNNGRDKPSILSDALEAVVGGIYLDGGYEEARQAVLSWYAAVLDETLEEEGRRDPKTELQERLQAFGGPAPRYAVLDESGPDHRKVFLVEVLRGDEALAAGEGPSKKEAEKHAARRALESLGKPGEEE